MARFPNRAREVRFSELVIAQFQAGWIGTLLVLSAYLQFKTIGIAEVKTVLGCPDLEPTPLQFVFHLSFDALVGVPVCNRQANVVDRRRGRRLARVKDELRFSHP